MKKILNYSLFALMLTATFGISSCKKKKETIAKITVLNTASQKVAGATVLLYAEPTPPASGGPVAPGTLLWEKTATTDASGVATFDFTDIYQQGQAGVVIANIRASADGKTGEGIIKVESETTSGATVFLSL